MLSPTLKLALVDKIDKVPVLIQLRISGDGVSRSWTVGAGIRGWRRELGSLPILLKCFIWYHFATFVLMCLLLPLNRDYLHSLHMVKCRLREAGWFV